jgi:tRNA(fMet)-specific endonuclease VapC
VKILDTDTCIEILRGNRKVIEKRASVADAVLTTWVTAAELYFGAGKSRDPAGNRTLVDEFLATLAVLGLDQASARQFGESKSRLERDGSLIPDADLFIASIALAHRADIVTGNQGHFVRIPGLTVEDWIRG